MTEAIHRHFAVPGITLVADVLGDPRNEPALFLHGGGQTRASWGKALEAVAHEGFYGVALDLRGHGESDWSADGNYELDAYCDDVRAVVAQLERKPFIVGASLGGMVGLLVAAESADATKGLAMIDIVPQYVKKGTHRILSFMTAYPDGFASVDEAAEHVATFLPHRPRPSDTSGLKRNLRQRDNGRYYWHWDSATLGSRHVLDQEAFSTRLEEAARRLDVPTLLVRGGNSEVVDDAGVQSFLAQAPHAQFVQVAGADHMVAGDKNDIFNQVVLQFLSAHRSP
jgi:non-heme chloroperoxidase